MNTTNAYVNTQAATMSVNEMIAFSLTRSASMLNDIKVNWDEKKDALPDILDRNRTLWAALASEIGDENESMPVELRQNLANLSLFVFQRTIELFTDPAPEKIDVLIRINREISLGLRGDSGE